MGKAFVNDVADLAQTNITFAVIRSITGEDTWKPFEMSSPIDKAGEMIFRAGSLVLGIGEIPSMVRMGKALIGSGKALFETWALGRTAGSTRLGGLDASELAEVGDVVETIKANPRVDVADSIKVKRRANGSVDLDYKYPDRHGLAATIGHDKEVGLDGVLGFEIKAGGDASTLGSGKDMFYSLMQRAESEGVAVNGVRAYWIDGTNSTNYMGYRAGLESGLTPHAAALQTWTGQRAADFGFTHVSAVVDNGRTIKAWFVRPPGG